MFSTKSRPNDSNFPNKYRPDKLHTPVLNLIQLKTKKWVPINALSKSARSFLVLVGMNFDKCVEIEEKSFKRRSLQQWTYYQVENALGYLVVCHYIRFKCNHRQTHG